MENIRNFAILAHIDHGKSTLADRVLEITHAIPERQMRQQFLDRMDLERERGITIKAQTVRIKYRSEDGINYVFNLIDTPGHVDFTYEVSRSLAACEGVLLVVDASQGVEAQTVANAHLAVANNLTVIPVINKIDLPNADPEKVASEVEEALSLPKVDAIYISAKTGQGVEELLKKIIEKIPEPKYDNKAPLKSLIFDSVFDKYRGVIIYTRLFEGQVKPGDRIKLMATKTIHEVEEVGYLLPDPKPNKQLVAGEVGYIIAGIKNLEETKVGDTITLSDNQAREPLPGYKEAKPMVFAGLYPADGELFEGLRTALEKLRLNDPSFVYEPESSNALGFGFRCGFLGLLHMEIIKERLEREYQLELIATAPSVAYRITKTNGQVQELKNPSAMPVSHEIAKLEEPYVLVTVITPPDYIGAIMELCQDRRGTFLNMIYLSQSRVELKYEMPLSEILIDFFDQLKSNSKGYASLDYEHIGYKLTELVKVDILIGGKAVDSLSSVMSKDKAYYRGRRIVEKLKEAIPRQLFEVPIQAAIGAKIICRETVKPLRKDVIAKLYGGDVTRKRKLLEKQKAGKKRMKMLGQVELPQEAFISFLKVDK
ncbi:MAG: elongation factor 4 [Actinobacteria bacterium]|nr:MAG: elongation factor 4 [Actinomycetota bacterium]